MIWMYKCEHSYGTFLFLHIILHCHTILQTCVWEEKQILSFHEGRDFNPSSNFSMSMELQRYKKHPDYSDNAHNWFPVFIIFDMFRDYN
mgnify:CR=1 FL=1